MSFPKWLRLRFKAADDSWYADNAARRNYGRFIRINPSHITPSSFALPHIGSGSCAAAYQLEDGRVLRVNTRADPAYQAFIRLALQRQDNPFYPKVFAAGFYPDKQIVVMEKLTPLCTQQGSTDEKFMRKLKIAHFTVAFLSYDSTKSESAAKNASELVLKDVVFCRTLRRSYARHKQAFRQLVADLRWLVREYNYDLHGKNIMVRPCGQLVVTDPVC